MLRLRIDGQPIEVSAGTKVIDAAARLGIFIPRLCYHPALGSVGACRLCACSFLEGPVHGVQMSCMVEAKEGMVVSTTAPEAVEFRRQVVEWLMANHPHDCPVCDEGGHCLLQEMTVSGGHGARRYTGRKRTYQDQDLGPLVQHEMNRCIHCYRCRRFYQEVAGGRDLGALGIGSRTSFARFADGPLESPFSGNLIDLCPTGVFTDKVSRYKGRRWDFQRSPSLCVDCSLGCATIVSARYREIVRIEAAVSETVNGHFLCDRGRFGFGHANSPERPRRARLQGQEAGYADALDAAAAALAQLPPGAIGCVGSARSSLETQSSLLRLCRLVGWSDPAFFLRSSERRKVQASVAGLPLDLAVSLRDLERADFALVVGADPLNEAPLLALALRQAVRKGATVAVLDPRPVSLPFDFLHQPLPSGELDAQIRALVEQALSPAGPAVPLAEKLAESRNPVVVCGTDVVGEETPGVAAWAARALHWVKGRAGLFYVLPGPNAFGAAAIAPDAPSFEALLPAIEAGEVRGLILCESDPLGNAADPKRVSDALHALECLVVLDHLPTPAVEAATLFLPTQNVFEAGGAYRNQGGTVQHAAPVHLGGTPIAETGNGDHPPRGFRSDIPGGEPQPAWQVLTELGRRLAPGTVPTGPL